MPQADTAERLQKVLAAAGVGSRRACEDLIFRRRVTVNGKVAKLGDKADPATDEIRVDGARVVTDTKLAYIALNKPRGLVTTRDDPEGRETIYECIADDDLPFLGPVGRLDKASEGLLLLTNDTRWANALLDPASHVDKTYHVQARTTESERVREGVSAGVKAIDILRVGSRSSTWFSIVLDEGKNRQIRRLFETIDIEVMRLVRVAIGPLELGSLAKGEWRHLTPAEVSALAKSGASRPRARSR